MEPTTPLDTSPSGPRALAVTAPLPDAGADDAAARPRRVRFKHPVRVTTVDGAPRAFRTLSANLSRDGLFVRMPQPLERGARVAIALEAQGRVLPFMQGEVRWCRHQRSSHEGRYQGVGIRFTEALHPRSTALVNYLVDTLDTGTPLRAAPRAVHRLRQGALAAAGLVVTLAAGLLLSAWVDRPRALDPGEGAAGPSASVEPPARPLTRGGDEAARHDEGGREPAAVRDEEAARSELAIRDDELAPLPPAAAELASAAPPALPVPAPESGAPATDAVAPAPVPPARRPPPLVVEGLSPAATLTTALPPLEAERQAAGASLDARARVSLPSGAMRALQWRRKGSALEVRPVLRAGAHVERVFTLAHPPRLVFDLGGRAPRASATLPQRADDLVSRVRVGRLGASTRVVLDLSTAPRAHTAGADAVVLQF